MLHACELGNAEGTRTGSGGPGAAAAARRAPRPPAGQAAAARPWRSEGSARPCLRGLECMELTLCPPRESSLLLWEILDHPSAFRQAKAKYPLVNRRRPSQVCNTLRSLRRPAGSGRKGVARHTPRQYI